METNYTILTDVKYGADVTEWHYHENPYFGLLLEGQFAEVTRKQKRICGTGTFLFQHSEDPHYHTCRKDNTNTFFVELKKSWFRHLSLNNELKGSVFIENPEIKIKLHHLYKESKDPCPGSNMAIEALLIEIFGLMSPSKVSGERHKPAWLKRLRELLHDCDPEMLSLNYLSDELGIHPGHICRDFSKHFNCSFGDYLRKIKVEKSMTLLLNEHISLTEIAFECGFSDQSHFIRCFKDINNITPSRYRRMILSR